MARLPDRAFRKPFLNLGPPSQPNIHRAMNESANPSSDLPCDLKLISTHWTTLSDPARFVTRYGLAVRAYLRALLPTQDDADEVEQELLLQVVAKGFPTVAPGRGQFRHYLIAVVRNAAFAYLRERSRRPKAVADLSHVAAEPTADHQWLRGWRECVLQNTWNGLREHQKRHSGNLFHTVLRESVDHPDEDSATLAARISSATNQPLSAVAFRKQLSRARQRFAELLIEEVSNTITNVTPETLADELRDLDLMKYVQTLLPDANVCE